MHKTRISKIIFKSESSFSSFASKIKSSQILFCVILIWLSACAKPAVVEVTLPEDKKLNCEKLEDAVVDAQEFRNKALSHAGSTAKNQARAFLFWPALMVTYVNIHEAIVAANERTVYLINIMQDKKCDNAPRVMARVATTPRVQSLKDLSEAYKSLTELYKSGALTEDEFITEKKKVLGQ